MLVTLLIIPPPPPRIYIGKYLGCGGVCVCVCVCVHSHIHAHAHTLYIYIYLRQRRLLVFHHNDHISVLHVGLMSLHCMYWLLQVHSFNVNRNSLLPVPIAMFSLVAEWVGPHLVFTYKYGGNVLHSGSIITSNHKQWRGKYGSLTTGIYKTKYWSYFDNSVSCGSLSANQCKIKRTVFWDVVPCSLVETAWLAFQNCLLPPSYAQWWRPWWWKQ
jgi:hypothetical protein